MRVKTEKSSKANAKQCEEQLEQFTEDSSNCLTCATGEEKNTNPIPPQKKRKELHQSHVLVHCVEIMCPVRDGTQQPEVAGHPRAREKAPGSDARSP